MCEVSRIGGSADPADGEDVILRLNTGIDSSEVDDSRQIFNTSRASLPGALGQILVSNDHHSRIPHNFIDFASQGRANNPSAVRIVVVKDGVVVIDYVGNSEPV